MERGVGDRNILDEFARKFARLLRIAYEDEINNEEIEKIKQMIIKLRKKDD